MAKSKKRPTKHPESPKETGKRLRRLRLLHSLRSGMLAKRLQMLPATYSNYETGLSKPSIANALKLVEFFDVTLDYIYRGELGGVPYEMATRIETINLIMESGSSPTQLSTKKM